MKLLVRIALIAIATALALLIRKALRPRRRQRPAFSKHERLRHLNAKQAAMELILGPMHDLAGLSIPRLLGEEAVNIYFFTEGIPGTGFCTMDLIEPDGSGPKPNRNRTFELVAFTRHKMDSSGNASENRAFSEIEKTMCNILNRISCHSYDTVLSPGDTCELRREGDVPTRHVIIDRYAPDGLAFEIHGEKHCLLLCLEVFQSEMDYARGNGIAPVLEKLKQAGHYPYSDLDRSPVY